MLGYVNPFGGDLQPGSRFFHSVLNFGDPSASNQTLLTGALHRIMIILWSAPCTWHKGSNILYWCIGETRPA